MGSNKLCRLCAHERDSFVRIYEEEGQKLNLATKIIKCLQIWLYPEDPLPKAVCIDCCAKLNQYFDFFETSSRAQLSLQVMFDPKMSKKEPKDEVKLETEQETEQDQQQDQDQDQDDDDDDDDDDQQSEEDSTNEDSELPEYVECVLSEKDVNGQNSASSRRKRRVPVKRTPVVKAPRERAPPRDRTNARESQPRKERASRARKERAEREEKERLKKEIKDEEQPAPEEEAEEPAEEVAEDAEGEARRGTRRRREVKADPEKPARPKAILEGYPWQCTDCPLVLATLQQLRAHHQTEHNQPPNFKCVQCAKVYTRYRSFARHVKLHRNPKKFRCEECGKCFSQKTVLQSHSTVHTDARPHVCPQCGKAFKQFSSLYLHSKCHLPDQVKPKFPCDVCHKDFATKHTLETHRKIHTGERNFICDVCGKSFIAKGSLDYHILTHSGEKPHHCPICGKGFKTARLLAKHATLHTGIKPHQCDVCGKQFRERGALREHNRIHTGAMPYTCEFCGKCFRFKGILTVHRRQHTGERPYSCAECRREFTNWANYNKHMKRRHRNEGEPAAASRNTNRTYQAPSVGTGSVASAIAPTKMTTTSPVAVSASSVPTLGNVYSLSHNVGDNSNSSSLTSQGMAPNVYSQGHVGNINSAVAKMAAANIYNSHLGNNSGKMGAMYHGGGAKMFHQQEGQDSMQPMGSYHVPSYVPAGLPMGGMGYYIPNIHHGDPSMDMLQHRMANNQ